MTAVVHLSGISKTYGSITAVAPTDLEIKSGEFVAILGPSGCGKTTLLRMIGGFVAPSSGKILLEGRDVTRLGPDRRPTNMVFQGYGLFPHMTVAQNVAYGLRLAGVQKAEREERVQQVLDLVHLGDFGPRKIDQMSGGQRQRVALARALVMRPKVLLLDEPLAALDLKLRRAMQEEFRRIHAAIGGTFIFVTHDQEEAMSLASRICVMDRGRIVQDGSPEEIYLQPKTRFISRFIGEANFFHGHRSGGRVMLENGLCFDDMGEDCSVDCIVRPERMVVAIGGDALPADVDMRLEACVEDVVFLGNQVQFRLRSAAGEEILISARGRQAKAKAGAPALVGWKSSDQRVLSE